MMWSGREFARRVNTNFRERDNLFTKDKKPVPTVSVIGRFQCIIVIRHDTFGSISASLLAEEIN